MYTLIVMYGRGLSIGTVKISPSFSVTPYSGEISYFYTGFGGATNCIKIQIFSSSFA